MTDKKVPSIESSLKSKDTEEFLDLIFYRPLGYRWATFFHKVGITPNTVTVFAIILGAASGIMFYFTNIWYNLIGMLLLVWANTYDSADGQLARMTGQKSELGRILDGACGDIWFISIYAAICFRLTPGWGIYIWLLAAITGFFHSKQAAMADYYRNTYLFFLKGKSGSELDNSVQQQEIYRNMPWKGNLLKKTFQFFYVNYTASQEQASPWFQKFFRHVHNVFGEKVPVSLGKEYTHMNYPLLKYTNILSFNTRVIALFISLFIRMPWLYFIFELTILNVLLIYMVWKHETNCKKLYGLVEKGQFKA